MRSGCIYLRDLAIVIGDNDGLVHAGKNAVDVVSRMRGFSQTIAQVIKG